MNNYTTPLNNRDDSPELLSSTPYQPSSNFKIGTLNCRGLRKTADPTVSSKFI